MGILLILAIYFGQSLEVLASILTLTYHFISFPSHSHTERGYSLSLSLSLTHTHTHTHIHTWSMVSGGSGLQTSSSKSLSLSLSLSLLKFTLKRSLQSMRTLRLVACHSRCLAELT
ncbi:hypothetical protein GOP47_0009143 [Adiantum capillus-veneris]|uniref:Uncharacterized protein n=1 Tax=Adiantum capillus-veneris TaxID=13818 RepID=A0A9D4ZIP4_ADICA|nr:hypothetical protein GOP47_0009143 [Adiantum capillus-veneris]